MNRNRAEGTSSGDASGNPSAFSYSVDFSYGTYVSKLQEDGFVDAMTGEALYMLERVSVVPCP